jgi:DNA-directed RNA polymerase subunit E"
MAKDKACRQCKTIFNGAKCPKCGAEGGSESFKGKVVVLNPENSEIAKNLKLHEKGTYAVRT